MAEKLKAKDVTLDTLLAQGPLDLRKKGLHSPLVTKLETSESDDIKSEIIFAGYGIGAMKAAVRIIREAEERGIDLNHWRQELNDK